MNKNDKFAKMCADLVMEHPNRHVMLAASSLDMLMGFADPGVKYGPDAVLSVPAQQYQQSIAYLVDFLAQTSIVPLFADALLQMDNIAKTVKKTQETLDAMGVKQL